MNVTFHIICNFMVYLQFYEPLLFKLQAHFPLFPNGLYFAWNLLFANHNGIGTATSHFYAVMMVLGIKSPLLYCKFNDFK